MTDIGRAGIVMKGDYNSASTYETLDAVSYDNGLYVAKQNVPTGIAPTNTTYWQLACTTKGITTGVVYSGSEGVFKIPAGVPTPFQENQYVVCTRSVLDGSIYALWYDQDVTGFRLATILFGNAPKDGESVVVQYLS